MFSRSKLFVAAVLLVAGFSGAAEATPASHSMLSEAASAARVQNVLTGMDDNWFVSFGSRPSYGWGWGFGLRSGWDTCSRTHVTRRVIVAPVSRRALAAERRAIRRANRLHRTHNHRWHIWH